MFKRKVVLESQRDEPKKKFQIDVARVFKFKKKKKNAILSPLYCHSN
jgi:hypothetical protein